MSNGDRIRRMTDEELATFIVKDMECSNLIDDAKCLKYRKIKRCDCEKCWFDWLKQDVNDGD